MLSVILSGRVKTLEVLLIILPVLIGVAYLTLVERKVLGAIQRRRGPNVVGIYGIFTPLADGLKLLRKEAIVPASANPVLFQLAPVITFVLALVGWTVMPIGEGRVYADVPRGVRFSLAIGSLGVYGVLLAGWASNSKYAFMGGLRSSAQMVSYEVSRGFIRVSVFLCAGSLNLTTIVHAQASMWYVIPLFPLFLMFRVTARAETNRHPFDLPEDESVLVSGFNTEYSAMGFALFFLGEYANMILMSSRMTVLFRGGWRSPRPFRTWIPGSIWFGLKVILFLFGFIWARAAYPRYRYDQLMRLGWKVFLPRSMGAVVFTSGTLVGRNGLMA
jgi:NADH-quinone oxidoreductase subunit H